MVTFSVIDDPSAGMTNVFRYPSLLLPAYVSNTVLASIEIMEFQNPYESECCTWVTFVIVLPSSGMVKVAISPTFPLPWKATT